jgi:hypothetical protein
LPPDFNLSRYIDSQANSLPSHVENLHRDLLADLDGVTGCARERQHMSLLAPFTLFCLDFSEQHNVVQLAADAYNAYDETGRQQSGRPGRYVFPIPNARSNKVARVQRSESGNCAHKTESEGVHIENHPPLSRGLQLCGTSKVVHPILLDRTTRALVGAPYKRQEQIPTRPRDNP